MFEILETPFPLMFAFVLYIFMGRQDPKKKPWVKVVRYLALGVIVINLLAWHNGYLNKYLYVGLNSNARQVTRFTDHIASLIKSGKSKQAVQLINKFNKDFPYAAADHKKSEVLIDQLINASSNEQSQSE